MRNSITTFMIPVLEESLDDRRVAQGNDWLGKRACPAPGFRSCRRPRTVGFRSPAPLPKGPKGEGTLSLDRSGPTAGLDDLKRHGRHATDLVADLVNLSILFLGRALQEERWP